MPLQFLDNILSGFNGYLTDASDLTSDLVPSIRKMMSNKARFASRSRYTSMFRPYREQNISP